MLVFPCVLISDWCIPGCEIAVIGHLYVKPLVETIHFPNWWYQVPLPSEAYESSSCSTCSPVLNIVNHFHYNQSTMIEWFFICISLVTPEVEHLFNCSLTIWDILLWSACSVLLSTFLLGVCHFFIYILEFFIYCRYKTFVSYTVPHVFIFYSNTCAYW